MTNTTQSQQTRNNVGMLLTENAILGVKAYLNKETNGFHIVDVKKVPYTGKGEELKEFTKDFASDLRCSITDHNVTDGQYLFELEPNIPRRDARAAFRYNLDSLPKEEFNRDDWVADFMLVPTQEKTLMYVVTKKRDDVYLMAENILQGFGQLRIIDHWMGSLTYLFEQTSEKRNDSIYMFGEVDEDTELLRLTTWAGTACIGYDEVPYVDGWEDEILGTMMDLKEASERLTGKEFAGLKIYGGDEEFDKKIDPFNKPLKEWFTVEGDRPKGLDYDVALSLILRMTSHITDTSR